MKIKWFVDDYLNGLGYWLESVEFLTSEPTKMTEQTVNTLLKKDDSLNVLDERISFYDEYGQTYVEHVPMTESTETLKQFMKKELPVEKDTSFFYLDSIVDMIQTLYPTYQVYGYYHFIMDCMTVLDNKMFLEELVHYYKKGCRNFEIGALCHGAPLPSGEIDLINHLGKPLLHVPFLKRFEYEEKYRYFDIHHIDGTIVFEKITMENLPLVLFSLTRGLNPSDIKQHFLDYRHEDEKPTNMTELKYYRYFTSERLLLKTKHDICCIADLEESHEPGFEGEYRFSDKLNFRESSRVILTQDIFNVLLDDFLDNPVKDITQTLTDFSKEIYDLADSLGYDIIKKTRWLRGRWFMENIELEDNHISKFVRRRKGMMSYDASHPDDTESNPTYPIEIVYDLQQKDSENIILKETNIAKLVTVLIDYQYRTHLND